MATSNDKFKRLARRWVGSIGAGGVADAVVTTIPLTSSSGLPTDTAVVATIDRVDANGIATPSLEESVVGVVSGDNLVTCTRGAEGTAQAHSAGAVVEILFTNKGWGDLIDGILEEHNQFGHTNTGGWIKADETWTYASATTITVPSGAASKYQKGDKIKLTQTTVKYFYIVGVADTTLTITGGSDYTLINAAITDNYYSKVENPQGFPQWFNWTPTYGGLDSMTYTSVTTNVARFRVIGSCCQLKIRANGTTGGTASTGITITLPIITTNQHTNINGANIYDSSGMGGFVSYVSGDSTRIGFHKYNDAAFGLGSGKGIAGELTYLI